MADAPVVHIGENSVEEVAYKLTLQIMRAEGLTINRSNLEQGWRTIDRKTLLDTYAECLQAVRGYRG